MVSTQHFELDPNEFVESFPEDTCEEQVPIAHDVSQESVELVDIVKDDFGDMTSSVVLSEWGQVRHTSE